MIAFISDLHLSDRTCGQFHLPQEAFTGVFRDLGEHARSDGEDHLNLVLLGDIFDLIHTEFWLNVPERCQPWGEEPSEECALRALRAVIEANDHIFALFRALPGQLAGAPAVTLTYLPGNHDRLCNVYPRARRLVAEVLGLQRKDPEAPFPTHFLDKTHDVFARHGHEFDPWNYEGKPPYDSAEPLAPVGDPITSLLLAKLPRLVRESLLLYRQRDPDAIDLGDINRITHSFRAMFDVRPFAAFVSWLFHQVEAIRDPAVREIVQGCINQTVRDFVETDYFAKWKKRHPYHGFKLGGMLWILEKLPVLALRSCRGQIGQVVRSLRSADPYRRHALRDMRRHGVRYVVYGHTHIPVQTPLLTQGNGPTRRESFYFNTGTWRPDYDETIDYGGFVGRKTLTYTLIYAPTSPGRPPTAEAWTGVLKDHRV